MSSFLLRHLGLASVLLLDLISISSSCARQSMTRKLEEEAAAAQAS